jgi:hypothetical protein
LDFRLIYISFRGKLIFSPLIEFDSLYTALLFWENRISILSFTNKISYLIYKEDLYMTYGALFIYFLIIIMVPYWCISCFAHDMRLISIFLCILFFKWLHFLKWLHYMYLLLYSPNACDLILSRIVFILFWWIKLHNY